MILYTDILPMAEMLTAVCIPFLFEKYVFGIRVGILQILFWIFFAQCAATYIGLAIILVFGPETIIGHIGQAVGGIGFIAIGAIPLIFLPIAVLLSLAWLGVKWIRSLRA